MTRTESDNTMSNRGGGKVPSGEPVAGITCTAGSEGGAWRRTTNSGNTPNGLTANRPLFLIGNAPYSYPTGEISRNKEGHFTASFTLDRGFQSGQGQENFRKCPEPAIFRRLDLGGVSERGCLSEK